MGILVAPYNAAMKLGYGFNSFTQTLCVNDAVVKDNRKVATEDDLRRLPQDSEDPDDISQVVTYTATFVEHASEVMDAMGVKGNVEIKLQGLGGGGGGASYVNTEQMKSSDVNFLIQVKVINQKLVADSVTRFNTIANLPASSFTETYGDSFISGFVEGGEFYALLSIKLSSSSKKEDVAANIHATISKPAFEASGDAAVNLNKLDGMSGAETSISVSWSGGGEIRTEEDRGQDWTIESMKRAANSFPERVARCPQRTHAILTKYSALRSFQELTNKGSPLDYENAGVYTSALLDAYMDYKDIWKTLATMTKDVQNGRLLAARVDKDNELYQYAQEAQMDYAQKAQAYFYPKMDVAGLEKIPRFERFQPEYSKDSRGTVAQSTNQTTSGSVATADQIYNKDEELAKVTNQTIMAKRKLANTQAGELFDPPLKPNDLTPYAGSLLGLDRARRDCRWEMIKIVKEVDAVTLDPAVAIDTSRVWQYLNPAVFRQLIPRYDPPPPPYTQDDMDKVLKQIVDLNIKLTKAQEQEQLDIAAAVATAVKPKDDEIERLKATQIPPETIETQKLDALRVAVESVNASMKQGIVVSGPGDGRMYSGNITGNMYTAQKTFRMDTVLFPKPFSCAPRAICGISKMDFNSTKTTAELSISCGVNQTTKDGVTLTRNIGDCFTYDCGVSWMTLPENGLHIETGICDTADIVSIMNPDVTCDFKVTFQNPFKTIPIVRVWAQAVSWQGANIYRRLEVSCSNTDQKGTTLQAKTWANTTARFIRLCWLAHEENEPRIRSGVMNITTESRKIVANDNSYKSYSMSFSDSIAGVPAFSMVPTVFTAISQVEINTDSNVRVVTDSANVTRESFDLTMSTWNDTTLYKARCVWIAITP